MCQFCSQFANSCTDLLPVRVCVCVCLALSRYLCACRVFSLARGFLSWLEWTIPYLFCCAIDPALYGVCVCVRMDTHRRDRTYRAHRRADSCELCDI